ncbi:hypothetical protein AMTRI_Chr05g70570 [Amborella trichopoda]
MGLLCILPATTFPNYRLAHGGSSLIPISLRKRRSLLLSLSSLNPKNHSPFFSSPVEKEDRNYLWKLAAGSIGGGALIKYGSILVPEITRPNLLQALVIIGLPVLLGVLVLIKASSADANSNWTPH